MLPRSFDIFSNSNEAVPMVKVWVGRECITPVWNEFKIPVRIKSPFKAGELDRIIPQSRPERYSAHGNDLVSGVSKAVLWSEQHITALPLAICAGKIEHGMGIGQWTDVMQGFAELPNNLQFRQMAERGLAILRKEAKKDSMKINTVVRVKGLRYW